MCATSHDKLHRKKGAGHQYEEVSCAAIGSHNDLAYPNYLYHISVIFRSLLEHLAKKTMVYHIFHFSTQVVTDLQFDNDSMQNCDEEASGKYRKQCMAARPTYNYYYTFME